MKVVREGGTGIFRIFRISSTPVMALPHAEAVLVPPVPAMPATDGGCVNEMHQLDARGQSDPPDG